MTYLKLSVSVLLLALLLTNCGGNSAPDTPDSPQGPTTGLENALLSFRAATTDPNDDDISYQFNWGDGNLSLWSDYVPSGDEVSANHSYSDTGTYEVIVRAQDEKEKMSEWSEPHNVSIFPDTNLAPLTPDSPEGPATGLVDTVYQFQAFTTDPNNDSVSYQFDWGDGNISPWSDYLPSGDTVSVTHSYSDTGTYEVIVRAQDDNEEMSEWSEPHDISIAVYSNSAPLTPDSPEGPATGFVDTMLYFKASTTDPDNDSITYLFDYGDGTVGGYEEGYIPSGDTAYFNHMYSESGIFGVRVRARDRNGATSEWSEPHSLSILIDYPDSVVGYVSGGRAPHDIAVLPNGEYIYVVCRDDQWVSVSDVPAHTPFDMIPVGYYIRGAAALPNSEFVYVTSGGIEGVFVIRTSDNAIVDTIMPLNLPDSYAAALPNGEYVYVTGASYIYVIRTSNNAIIDSVGTANTSQAQGIAALPNGEYVYAANGNNSVLAIRTSDNSVAADIAIQGRPFGVTALPDNQYVYVSVPYEDKVYVIQTSDHTVVDSVQVNSPQGLVAHPSGEFVYVTNYDDNIVEIIRTDTRAVIKTISVSEGPWHIAAHPTGDYIYVSCEFSSTVIVIGK